VVSKAVLKQAEEEVTAKPSTAFPLARVVMALVEQGHDLLGRVFVAKLISMSSHWIVGTVIGREPVCLESRSISMEVVYETCPIEPIG
jgi:nucleoporin GLE1